MGRRKKRQVIGKSNVVKFNHAQLPSTTTWSANPNAKEMQKKVSLIKSTTGPFCQDRITSNIETIKKNRQRQKHNHKAPESIEQHIIAQIDQNQLRMKSFKNEAWYRSHGGAGSNTRALLLPFLQNDPSESKKNSNSVSVRQMLKTFQGHSLYLDNLTELEFQTMVQKYNIPTEHEKEKHMDANTRILYRDFLTALQLDQKQHLNSSTESSQPSSVLDYVDKHDKHIAHLHSISAKPLPSKPKTTTTTPLPVVSLPRTKKKKHPKNELVNTSLPRLLHPSNNTTHRAYDPTPPMNQKNSRFSAKGKHYYDSWANLGHGERGVDPKSSFYQSMSHSKPTSVATLNFKDQELHRRKKMIESKQNLDQQNQNRLHHYIQTNDQREEYAIAQQIRARARAQLRYCSKAYHSTDQALVKNQMNQKGLLYSPSSTFTRQGNGIFR